MIKNPAVYNNRAITNIKLKNYPPALADCNTVIQSEPNNIKGLYLFLTVICIVHKKFIRNMCISSQTI